MNSNWASSCPWPEIPAQQPSPHILSNRKLHQQQKPETCPDMPPTPAPTGHHDFLATRGDVEPTSPSASPDVGRNIITPSPSPYSICHLYVWLYFGGGDHLDFNLFQLYFWKNVIFIKVPPILFRYKSHPMENVTPIMFRYKSHTMENVTPIQIRYESYTMARLQMYIYGVYVYIYICVFGLWAGLCISRH